MILLLRVAELLLSTDLHEAPTLVQHEEQKARQDSVCHRVYNRRFYLQKRHCLARHLHKNYTINLFIKLQFIEMIIDLNAMSSSSDMNNYGAMASYSRMARYVHQYMYGCPNPSHQ